MLPGALTPLLIAANTGTKQRVAKGRGRLIARLQQRGRACPYAQGGLQRVNQGFHVLESFRPVGVGVTNALFVVLLADAKV